MMEQLPNLPRPLYPGHPLTIILHAIKNFDTPEEATTPTHYENGEPCGSKLSGCKWIDGHPDTCRLAVKLIQMVVENKIDPADLPGLADVEWLAFTKNLFQKEFLPGMAQASQLWDTIWPELAKKWAWDVCESI